VLEVQGKGSGEIMNKRIKPSLVLALGLVCSAASARAVQGAVIISIDHVDVPASSVALVGVYASSNSNDVISGFDLPLDINDDGYTAGILPAGFKLDPSDVRNAIYGNTGLDMPQPQTTLINVDGIAVGSGANEQLTSTPTLLFDLAFDVADTVPDGTSLPLEIEVPNAPFQSLFDVAGPNSPAVAAPTNGSPVYGSITVVPEAGGIGLASIAALYFCFSRVRRPAEHKGDASQSVV
jgi:hypothetical protein